MLIPPAWYGIPELSIVERRMLGIVVYAIIMWISEAVPLWTTSISILLIMLFLVSDAGLRVFTQGYDAYSLGYLVRYRSIMSTFADPVLMLFLGGLSLAAAATSVGLDVRLARAMLRPLGDRSEGVLLGFMIVTATLSMFMNNTATTALMFSVALPILRSLPGKSKDKLPIILSIPIAANLGGMATPMGTPANLLALNFLNDPKGMGMDMTYGDWIFYMMPLTIFLVFVSWLLLLWLFPFHHKNLFLDIKSTTENKRRQKIVTATFFVTIMLWILEPYLGSNTYVTGIFPLAVLTMTGIIGRLEIRHINWEVLWLVAGGLAIGVGMDETHLAHRLVRMVPFYSLNPWVLALSAGFVCFLLSTFISNTAATKLLLSILPMALTTNPSINGDKGLMVMVIMGVTASASLAMALPVSTAPNALAYAFEEVEQKQMAKAGLIIGIMGMLVTYLLFSYLSFANYM